jgi:hypothetical protein
MWDTPILPKQINQRKQNYQAKFRLIMRPLWNVHLLHLVIPLSGGHQVCKGVKGNANVDPKQTSPSLHP